MAPGPPRAYLAKVGARVGGHARGVAAAGGSWRGAYRAFGLPADTVPPAEALAAWAAHPGGVPSQGPVLDTVNAFSLQHGVAVAGYDLGPVEGNVWLRPSRGIEIFVGAGRLVETPTIGELILVDDADQVLARRWHGSIGQPFVATPGAADVLLHVDVLPAAEEPDAGPSTAADLAGALARLAEAFLGGVADVRVLARSTPVALWPAG